jgi:hypothetical protein
MTWDWKVICSCAVAAGAVVGWVLSQYKTYLEIQKLRRESEQERPPSRVANFRHAIAESAVTALPVPRRSRVSDIMDFVMDFVTDFVARGFLAGGWRDWR